MKVLLAPLEHAALRLGALDLLHAPQLGLLQHLHREARAGFILALHQDHFRDPLPRTLMRSKSTASASDMRGSMSSSSSS